MMPPPTQSHQFMGKGGVTSIHWFRHGLRLHDNPALLESLKNSGDFYPVFIFDGEVAGLYSEVLYNNAWGSYWLERNVL